MDCKLLFSTEKLANQAGVNVSNTSDGRFRIKEKGSGADVFPQFFNTKSEVRAALVGLLDHNKPHLDGNLPFPIRGTPLNGNPPGIGRQLGEGYEIANSAFRAGAQKTFVGIGSFLTPIKTFAANVEQAGFGKALTGIYEPLQDGLRVLAKEMENTIRPGLEKKTYGQALRDLNKISNGLDEHQLRMAVLAPEALTKQEIAEHLKLTPEDVEFSKVFTELGVAEDIPKLMGVNALIDMMMANPKKAANVAIPYMRTLVGEGKLPMEYSEVIDRVSAMVGNEETIADFMKTLGMIGVDKAGNAVVTNEGKAALWLRSLMGAQQLDPISDQIIAGFRVRPKPGFSYNIPMIYRHAIAPELKPNFKNGFEQFAAERGMSQQAKLVSNERMRILEDRFKARGLDMKKIMQIDLPVYRQFIDVGMYPSRQYGDQMIGNINPYLRVLADGMQESATVLNRRVLAGNLNPHELNPIISASKHLRNLFMHEHVDPLMPKIRDHISNVRASEPGGRAGQILEDHVNEAIGLPDEGFKKWNRVFQSTFNMFGMHPDDQFVERMVSTLTKITSYAAIPFRPALVLRNYTQTALTAAYIGPEAWYEGLKVALGKDTGGYSFAAMREAIDRTIKAGAIDAEILPIGVNNNILGIDVAKFKGVPLQKVQQNMEELFNKGFSAYRTGDDFGRVVAYHGFRFRANKFKAELLNGELTLEEFKSKAKVKIFHEVEEAEFDRLYRAGQIEEGINYLGKKLADKAHFNYGNANHPVGWSGPVGRLFGQFGTFPTQYAQALLDGVTRGTVKDRMEFAAVHGAFNSGIVAAGLALDTDLESWSMFQSLQFQGGPYAEVGLQLALIWAGNDAEKSLARRSLGFMKPSMENPRSIFIPGSYFFADLKHAFADDPFEVEWSRAMGFTPIRAAHTPQSKVYDFLHWIDEIQP